MLYKDFVREKSHHLTKIKSAEGYPCVFDKSKGKALKNYKVYGNSTQDGTPSTTSPIEIESVGELSATNLLDVKAYFPDFLDEEGNIVYNQNNFSTIAKKLLTDEFKENTQYTLSCTVEISNADKNGVAFRFYDSSDTYLSSFIVTSITGSATIRVKMTNNINTTIKYAQISYGSRARRCDVKISNLKIEDGTVSTGHIPDGKYGIPVLVRGKNIFGGTAFRDKLIELGGTLDTTNKTVTITASQLNNKVLFDKFDADKRYTFIFRGYNTNTSVSTHNTNTKIVYSDDTFDNGFFNSKVGIKGTWFYKSTENKPIKHLIGAWHTASTVFYYEECGIFEGTISLDEFEPYSGIQTNIFLDAPLRRIKVIEGNKKGDYGDYIDFKRQKVIRNISEVLLNGSEDWHASGYNSQITTNYMQFWSSYYREIISNNILSNKFKCVGQKEWENLNLAQEFLAITTPKDLGIRLSKSKVTSLDEFTQWLSENNVVVLFSLVTPREEAITLPPILTQTDYNIITTTTTVTPSNIEVKYIAK